MRNLITLLIFVVTCTTLQATNGGTTFKSNWDDYMDIIPESGEACIHVEPLFILIYFKLHSGQVPTDMSMRVTLNGCVVTYGLSLFTPVGDKEYRLTVSPDYCIGTPFTHKGVLNYSIELIYNIPDEDLATIFAPYDQVDTNEIPETVESGSKLICPSTLPYGFGLQQHPTDVVSSELRAQDEETSIETNSEIFPNPFTNEFQVNVEIAKEESLLIRLIDITGKTVYQWSERNVTEGIFNTTIDTSNLPIGWYACVIQSDSHTEVIKLVKEKE